MWSSVPCNSQSKENSQQIHTDYLSPEKKLKQNSESEALLEAIECCKNQEMGIEEAAIIYGIPKQTLRAKLKDNNFSVIDEKYKVFVLSDFPAEAETDLIEYLNDVISSQALLTPVEVRRLGYELLYEKYKLNGLPEEKNCLLGQRWYKKFISHYPQFNFENSQLTVHQDVSQGFFNALECFVTKYEIPPSRIFSVEELELKFRASNADDPKILNKTKFIYTDAKALCCISPTGIFVPPIFLSPQGNCETTGSCENINYTYSFFEEQGQGNYDIESAKYNVENNCEKSKHLSTSQVATYYDKLKKICRSNIRNLPTSEDLADIEKQIKIHINKNVLPMSEENEEELREKLYELRNKIISKYERTLNEVTQEIFYIWFRSFVNFVKPNIQKKVLLLLSDQNYIKYFKTLELAQLKGVIFLVLPFHSIHKIHPLDGFAMSLNRNLSTCTRCWVGQNLDSKVQEVPLHLLFKKAYNETSNPSIAKNGFLYSGIWPINRNIFESTELGGESIFLQKNSIVGNCLLKKNFNIKSRSNSALIGITKKSDIEKLCRICMKEKTYMKPLFELSPTPEPNYQAKKISEITKIPIFLNDGLPGCICQYCLVQLMDTIKTKNLAIESYEKQMKLKDALERLYFENENSVEKDLLPLFQLESNEQNDLLSVNELLSKNFEINSVCRICMEHKPLMTYIFFNPQDGTSFYTDICKKIMEVSQCQVHIHDGLSSFICPFCRTSINQASEYIQKVISSDKRFREIISQFKQKR